MATSPVHPGPSGRVFARLLVQVAVVLAPFAVTSGSLRPIVATVLASFSLHYWAPRRFKEPIWIGACLVALGTLLGVVPVALVFGASVLIFLVAASRLPYWGRVGVIVAMIVCALLLGTVFRGVVPVPEGTLRLFGLMYAFRTALYLYELRAMTARPTFEAFAAYFFIFPTSYQLIVPIVDYETMRKAFRPEEADAIAQRGVRWLAAGMVQLMVFRYLLVEPVVELFADPMNPSGPWQVFLVLCAAYLSYLSVSGVHHVYIGTMHLFGYDMPRAHRYYALARSPLDLWRRVNLYWKDFLHKLVYLPVYFLIRKRPFVAQLVAMASVFFASWLAHLWMYTWDSDLEPGAVTLGLVGREGLIWLTLGLLCLVQQVVEELKRRRRRGRRVVAPASRFRFVRVPVQVFAMGLVVATLWSMLYAPSLGEWKEAMVWW